MGSPEQIIVGYDRQAAGRDALALAELLARTLGAGLLVAHVNGGDAAQPELGAEVADALAASAVAHEVRVLERDSPAHALRELAEKEAGTGLIALGSTHRAGVGRVFPGPVAERLLGAAPWPVAIAPRGFAGAEAGPVRPAERLRVLEVAYDGSQQSEAALRLASAIALAAAATLRVIAVGFAVSPPADFGAPVTTPPRPAPQTPDLQERLHAVVADLPSELRALPVYERGAPAPLILARAEEGVDMIVMGSRGQGPLSSALLGSTSSAVVAQAPCPVLITPRPAE